MDAIVLRDIYPKKGTFSLSFSIFFYFYSILLEKKANSLSNEPSKKKKRDIVPHTSSSSSSPIGTHLNALYSGQYEEEDEPVLSQFIKKEPFEEEERPLKKSKKVSFEEIESLFAKKFEEQARAIKIDKEIFEGKMELQRLENEAKIQSLIDLFSEKLKKEPVDPQPLSLSESVEVSSFTPIETVEEEEEEQKKKSIKKKKKKGGKKFSQIKKKKKASPKKVTNKKTTRQSKLVFKRETEGEDVLLDDDHDDDDDDDEEETNGSRALVVLPEADEKEKKEEQLKEEEEARIQFAKEQDNALHDSLVVYTGYIGSIKQTNVGVSMAAYYKLNTVLEKLNSEIDVYKQRSDAEEEERERDFENSFITDEKYRVLLLSNQILFVQPEGSGYPIPIMVTDEAQRKKMGIDVASSINRINTANVLIHTWFARKALKHNSQEDPSHLISIVENRPFAYDVEIVRKWFPCFNAGNGTILLENLECHAFGVKQGQGFGKKCLFCEMQFVGIKCGTTKYSHHPNLCDTLANLSNDERIILETVIKKCGTSKEFADHDFIKSRGKRSFLRLATEEEVAAGIYVDYAEKAEKVRVNMTTLMAMRSKCYDFFMGRIRTMDRATDEKNIDAKAMPGLLDCFNLNSRINPKKNKSKKAKQSIDPEDGFLFRTLVDSDGNNFMQTKTVKVKSKRVWLRNFDIDPETGFGSEMYFSRPMGDLPPFNMFQCNPMTVFGSGFMHAFDPTLPMPTFVFNPNVPLPGFDSNMPVDPNALMPQFMFNPNMPVDPSMFQFQQQQQQQQNEIDMSSNLDFSEDSLSDNIENNEIDRNEADEIEIERKLETFNHFAESSYYDNSNNNNNNQREMNSSIIVYETPVIVNSEKKAIKKEEEETEVPLLYSQEFGNGQYMNTLSEDWSEPNAFKVEENDVFQQDNTFSLYQSY